MERNINSLLASNMEANDGKIGDLDDFYFDDDTWTIRYLVIKTNDWTGHKVLIGIGSLTKHPFATGAFAVNLTVDQIKASPDIDTDKPVSRQHEARLNQHYLWNNYWEGGPFGGSIGIINAPPVKVKESDSVLEEDVHLRSAIKVIGYHVHALDGEIGHVNDIIFDDQTWRILYLVIDTHNFIGGKKVLVKVNAIKSISFLDSEILVNLTTNAVNRAKLFEQ